MNWHLKHLLRLVLLSCLAASATGCAGQRFFQQKDEPDRNRVARQEAAVRYFDEQRDQAQFHAAMNDWQQGNSSRARRSVQLILDRNPEHHQARLLLAELYLSDHQPEQAIETLIAESGDGDHSVESPHDHDATWQHTLGLAYEALGDVVRARNCYQRAADLQPENELFSLSYQAAIDELGLLAEEARLEPEDEVAEAAPGRAQFQRREPAGSARRTSEPTDQNPVRAAIHEQPVFTDASLAKSANVQTIVALIEVTDPDLTAAAPELPLVTDDAVAQAIEALEQGQSAQAVEICRAALRADSDSAPLYRILGVGEYRQGNYAASQSALQQALSLDNSNGLSYFLMGCTLVKLDQQAAADRHFAQARVLDPRF